MTGNPVPLALCGKVAYINASRKVAGLCAAATQPAEKGAEFFLSLRVPKGLRSVQRRCFFVLAFVFS